MSKAWKFEENDGPKINIFLPKVLKLFFTEKIKKKGDIQANFNKGLEYRFTNLRKILNSEEINLPFNSKTSTFWNVVNDKQTNKYLSFVTTLITVLVYDSWCKELKWRYGFTIEDLQKVFVHVSANKLDNQDYYLNQFNKLLKKLTQNDHPFGDIRLSKNWRIEGGNADKSVEDEYVEKLKENTLTSIKGKVNHLHISFTITDPDLFFDSIFPKMNRKELGSAIYSTTEKFFFSQSKNQPNVNFNREDFIISAKELTDKINNKRLDIPSLKSLFLYFYFAPYLNNSFEIKHNIFHLKNFVRSFRVEHNMQVGLLYEENQKIQFFLDKLHLVSRHNWFYTICNSEWQFEIDYKKTVFYFCKRYMKILILLFSSLALILFSIFFYLKKDSHPVGGSFEFENEIELKFMSEKNYPSLYKSPTCGCLNSDVNMAGVIIPAKEFNIDAKISVENNNSKHFLITSPATETYGWSAGYSYSATYYEVVIPHFSDFDVNVLLNSTSDNGYTILTKQEINATSFISLVSDNSLNIQLLDEPIASFIPVGGNQVKLKRDFNEYYNQVNQITMNVEHSPLENKASHLKFFENSNSESEFDFKRAVKLGHDCFTAHFGEFPGQQELPMLDFLGPRIAFSTNDARYILTRNEIINPSPSPNNIDSLGIFFNVLIVNVPFTARLSIKHAAEYDDHYQHELDCFGIVPIPDAHPAKSELNIIAEQILSESEYDSLYKRYNSLETKLINHPEGTYIDGFIRTYAKRKNKINPKYIDDYTSHELFEEIKKMDEPEEMVERLLETAENMMIDSIRTIDEFYCTKYELYSDGSFTAFFWGCRLSFPQYLEEMRYYPSRTILRYPPLPKTYGLRFFGDFSEISLKNSIGRYTINKDAYDVIIPTDVTITSDSIIQIIPSFLDIPLASRKGDLKFKTQGKVVIVTQ